MPLVVRLVIACFLGALLLPPAAFASEMERPITAWPLLYKERTNDTAQTDVLWPLFRYERNKTYERHAFRPFIFSTESDPAKDFRKTSVLWPISIYTHEGETTSYHLFPFYWYKDSPKDRYSVFFPLYWNGATDSSSYFHLWPLFGINRKGAGYAEYSVVYPFFRYGRDTATDELEVNAPWPLVQYHRTEGEVSSRLLPLYWHSRTQSGSSGFAFPYYWQEKTDKSAHGVFPLWYSSRSKDAQTDIVLPLYFSSASAGSRSTLLFPLYFRNDKPDDHYRYVFPVYYRNWTGKRSFTTVLPLYYDLKSEQSRLQVGVPLYLNYENPAEKVKLFFPLYYHVEDREKDSSFNYLFPFYGSYRRGEFDSRHYVLFPLFARFRDQGTGSSGWDVLWPLFHHESSPSTSETRALPFYLQKSAAESGYTIGFPLYWHFRSGDSSQRHFVPFYGEHTEGNWYRKRFIVGPLYIDTRDDHAQLSRQDAFFFLYSSEQRNDRKRSWLFPFYYHRDEPGEFLTLGSLAFLPPYYINKQEGDGELFHIWPFYGKSRSGSYEERSALWPLIRFGEDPANDEHMTHILLYYSSRKGTDSQTFFLPLWGRRSTAQETTDASLFLHWYEHTEVKDRTVLSLFWLIPPDISLFRLEREPGLVSHRFFPLYSFSRDERTDTLSWSILWILLSHKREGEFTRQTDFLWKFITYERTDAVSYDFRILWRFVRSAQTATSSVFEFNPFYYSEQEEGKGSYWAVLGGLFGVETKGEEKKYRFFWFF